ncbi:hypothetical protein EPH_0031210 [Eimeria praecox]|uniref:Uncharacterized protein n=1 Tax=Eimeria praecox TaxID=51316 RepID=U6G1I7_9EIME|nr:hypothetical protein EPH_0031210 [Eimeria praecox]
MGGMSMGSEIASDLKMVRQGVLDSSFTSSCRLWREAGDVLAKQKRLTPVWVWVSIEGAVALRLYLRRQEL